MRKNVKHGNALIDWVSRHFVAINSKNSKFLVDFTMTKFYYIFNGEVVISMFFVIHGGSRRI